MTFDNQIKDPEIVGYLRKLMLMALGFFVLTTVIGIVNVLDIADEFLYETRGILLFHLHAGTIAWISTGVICSLIWLYSQDREVSDEFKEQISKFYTYWQMVIPTYALVILISFYYEFYLLLPVFAILTIIGFFWASYLAFVERKNIQVFTTAHLSFIVGLAMAGYAGFIGLLAGLQYTLGVIFLSFNPGQAHAAAQEVGFIFIVITGMVELFIKGKDIPSAGISGVIQVSLFAISAFATSLGLMLNIPALLQLGLPLELIGLVLFFVRMGPALFRIDNLKDPAKRYFVIVPFFLLVAISLFLYVLFVFFIPENLNDPYTLEVILAINHGELIGAASGSIFGMITAFSMNNREGKMEWADLVGFSLMYLGLIGFVMGFLLQFSLHSAALMGIGILILITASFSRLTN